jgi:hypothetical protein
MVNRGRGRRRVLNLRFWLKTMLVAETRRDTARLLGKGERSGRTGWRGMEVFVVVGVLGERAWGSEGVVDLMLIVKGWRTGLALLRRVGEDGWASKITVHKGVVGCERVGECVHTGGRQVFEHGNWRAGRSRYIKLRDRSGRDGQVGGDSQGNRFNADEAGWRKLVEFDSGDTLAGLATLAALRVENEAEERHVEVCVEECW